MKTRNLLFVAMLFVVITSFSVNSFAAEEKGGSLIAEVLNGKPLGECSKPELIKRYTVLISAFHLEQGKNISSKLELMIEKINNKELRGQVTPEMASELRITVMESFLEARTAELEAEKSLKTLIAAVKKKKTG